MILDTLPACEAYQAEMEHLPISPLDKPAQYAQRGLLR